MLEQISKAPSTPCSQNALAFFAIICYYIPKARFLNGLCTGGYASLTYNFYKMGGMLMAKKLLFAVLEIIILLIIYSIKAE